jgi:hypothetical protein
MTYYDADFNEIIPINSDIKIPEIKASSLNEYMKYFNVNSYKDFCLVKQILLNLTPEKNIPGYCLPVKLITPIKKFHCIKNDDNTYTYMGGISSHVCNNEIFNNLKINIISEDHISIENNYTLKGKKYTDNTNKFDFGNQIFRSSIVYLNGNNRVILDDDFFIIINITYNHNIIGPLKAEVTFNELILHPELQNKFDKLKETMRIEIFKNKLYKYTFSNDNVEYVIMN